MHLRSPETGLYLKIGCGVTDWDEYTEDAAIDARNKFCMVEWNLEGLTNQIKKIGIKIEHAINNTVNVDRITCLVKNKKHFDMRRKSVKYKIRPGESSATIELGPVPDDLTGYIKQLYAFAEQNQYAGEDR